MDPSNEKFLQGSCSQLEGSSNNDDDCLKEQGSVIAVDSLEESLRSGSAATMSEKIPAMTKYRLSPEEVQQKLEEAPFEGQKKSKKDRRYRVHPGSGDDSSSDSSQSDPEENPNEPGKCGTDESNFKLQEPKLKLGLTSMPPTADHPQGTPGASVEVSQTTVDFGASGEVKMDITSAEGSDGCVFKEGLVNAESLENQVKPVADFPEISPAVSQFLVAAMEVDVIQTDDGTDGSQRCEKPLSLGGRDSSDPAIAIGHKSLEVSLQKDFTDLQLSERSHFRGMCTSKAKMYSETDSGSCFTETSSVPVKTESKEDIESSESLKDTTVNVTTAKKLDDIPSGHIGFRARFYETRKKEEISKVSSREEKIHQTLAVVSPERASLVQDVSSNKIIQDRLPAMTACLTIRESEKYSSNLLPSTSAKEHIPSVTYPGIMSSSVGDHITNEEAMGTISTVAPPNSSGNSRVVSENATGYATNQQESCLLAYSPPSNNSASTLSPHNYGVERRLDFRRIQNGENITQNDHTQILKQSAANNVALDQLYTDMLAQKLQQLSVKQLLQQQSFDKFCPQFQESSTASARPCFRIFVRIFFENLYGEAVRLENLFKKYICVPDELLRIHLEPLQEQKIVLEQVPSQIRQALLDLVAKLVQEYKERNAVIQMYELELMKTLLQKAVAYYTEEMKYMIQTHPGHLDDGAFKSYHEEVQKETEAVFLQAADLKHEHWTTKYSTDLRNQLKLELKALEKQRQTSTHELELILEAVMTGAVEEYKMRFVQEKQKHRFNLKASNALAGLNLIGSAANQAASQYFQQQCKRKNLEMKDPQVIPRVNYYRRKLDKEMDSLFAVHANDVEFLQEEQSRSYEDSKAITRAVDVLQQDQNHYSEDSRAMPRTGPRYSHSPEGPTESAVAGRYSLSGYSHSVNMSTSKRPDLVQTHSHKSLGPPRSWPLLPKLPECELAIHFGLHRTLAGIVTPGTEDILVLYDINNCLYFDHPHLLLCSEDPKCQKYKPSRIPNILETVPNLPHEVIIENTKRFMRLEELVACLFSALRWRTELDQMVEISNSVICVPQCLNQTQRKTIQDAARVAGFRQVTLINDTSAIALAFMLSNEIVKSSVIVANTSEGFIDAGYFNFDNGLVYRAGVSGEYFTKKKGYRNLAYKSLYYLRHFGMEYDEFRENVLQIFSGYVNDSGSPSSKRHPYVNYIILCGNNKRFVKQICGVLDSDSHFNRKEVKQVEMDDKTALFGAAYLTVLNDFKAEHPICNRWVALTKLEPSKELQIFMTCLLDHNPAQGLLTKSNPSTRGNLDEADFTSLKENFYLNERQQGHKMKMNSLKKVLYLQTSARNLSHVSDYEKQEIIAQIGTIHRDMQTSELPVEQLCVYDCNLDEWLDKVSP